MRVFAAAVTFRAGPHVSGLTAVVRALSPGAHAVTWFSGYREVGTGDGVFVDADRASARWCAAADVLVHSSPMRTVRHPAGPAVLTAYARGDDEWHLCARDGDTKIAVPHRDLLPALAAVYGWAIHGNAPTTWSFGAG